MSLSFSKNSKIVLKIEKNYYVLRRKSEIEGIKIMFEHFFKSPIAYIHIYIETRIIDKLLIFFDD